MTKKERAEMVALGRKCAEAACTDEKDQETADDVIQFPEEYAIQFYPYKGFVGHDCPMFATFKAAFVEWIRDTYDADRVS